MKSMKTLINGFLVVGIAAIASSFTTPPVFFKDLKTYCKTLPSEFEQISSERKKDLQEIGDFVLAKREDHQTVNLLFICTSNSRRSHMSQIWAQTAAAYYGIDSIWTYSGGTEATAVNINAIKALKRSGFNISSGNKASNNPVWLVSGGKEMASWTIFSKKYDDSHNPKKSFGAVMVCSEADKSCPFVEGADVRVGLPFEDPKYFDGTPSQDQKYDERCRQIAREMFFLMDYVKQHMILKEEAQR